jgi:hypothetical protein
MSWLSALLSSGREGLRVERAMADVDAIVRAVIAVTAAAVIGWSMHDPAAATMLSVGSFITSMGTLVSRLRHRITTAAAMAVSYVTTATIGVLLHGLPWLFLLVLAAAAFGAGMARALGLAPGVRSCLVVMGLMVTGELAPNLHAGRIMVTWIAAGAALVVIAQLLPPYGPRYRPQRTAVAAVYTELAAVAGAGKHYVSSEPFTAARRGLAVLPGFARAAAAPLFGLLGTAEWIRRSLEAARPGEVHDPDAVSAALAAVAATVASGRVQAGLPAGSAAQRGLDAELREAARLARLSTGKRLPDALGPHREILGLYAGSAPARVLARLRGELSYQSPVFRHAVRLAVGVVLGELVGRAIGSWGGWGIAGHGFWVAMATMLVLFPDYGKTISRGLGRAVGAVLGGLIGWMLSLIPLPPAGLAVATVALAVGAFLTLRTGQMVVNIWITAWIVFLFHNLGEMSAPTAWARAADTVVGSALAVTLFLVWPTWSTRHVPELLSDWLGIASQLIPELLTGYADVGAADVRAIDGQRARSRIAREKLVTTIDQAESEPVNDRSPWTPDQLSQIEAAIIELARCMGSLREHLPRSPDAAVPELAELADPVHEHLRALALAAAGGEAVTPGALAAAVAETTSRLAGDPAGHPAVVECTNAVVAVERLTGIIADRRRRSFTNRLHAAPRQ